MDFLKFLKEKKDEHSQSPKKPKTDNKLFSVKKQYSEFRKEIEQERVDQVLKKGDFVRIIQLKNSHLNHYKGYNGEIREYRRDADTAYVVLEALNSGQSICFPITHFIKREFN